MNQTLRQYLNSWYHSDAGQFFADEVQSVVDKLLTEIFGYYAIQLGYFPPERDLLAQSRIITHIHAGRNDMDVSCRDEQLPFATDAVDLLLLPHSLELSEDPHAILREVDRMLVPEGYLIIIGFNPWTAWGLWQWGRFRKCYPFYTHGRVRDWLSLLGFEYLADHSRYLNTLEIPLPIKLAEQPLIHRFGQKAAHRIAGGYVILAQKKVTTVTPVRPRWQFKPRLVSTGITEPSTRKMPRVCRM